jgi:hypothetical protein
MSKQQEQSPKILGEEYLKLKDKIVNGTVTKEEVEKLHADFNAYDKKDGKDIPRYQNKSTVIKDSMEDLGKSGIFKENMHKFVGQLFEIETKIEIDKINLGKQSTGVMRENSSVLKPALTVECVQNGFARDIFEAVKNDTPKAAIEKMVNIEVPPFLQNHFSKMQEAYSLQKKEGGPGVKTQENVDKYKNAAASTLGFNAISNVVTSYIANEIGGDRRVIDKYNDLSLSVYKPKDPSSLISLNAKISGNTPNPQDLENLKKDAEARHNEIQVKNAQKPSFFAPPDGQDNKVKIEHSTQSQPHKDSPDPATKPPTLFDKVKAFVKEAQAATKETMHTVVENVIPGRRNLNQMFNEIKNSAESKPKEQTNDVTPEAKSRTWQKAFPSGTKIAPPPQTPAVKNNPQQHKGHGGRGD